jgi:hypothetical protein
MSEENDLKSLEKKAYRSIFDDGLWDLFIGLIILSLGISTFLGSLLNLSEAWIFIIPVGLLNLLAFLLFYLGKKYITVPRMGFVTFGTKRKSKQQKLKIFLFAFFILNITLFVLPLTGILNYVQFEPLLLSLILGICMFTLPFCIIAYFLDFTRLYIYAFLTGIGFFLIDLLNPIFGSPIDIFLTFGISGGIIVAIGLYLFIRFLKKYPLSN